MYPNVQVSYKLQCVAMNTWDWAQTTTKQIKIWENVEPWLHAGGPQLTDWRCIAEKWHLKLEITIVWVNQNGRGTSTPWQAWISYLRVHLDLLVPSAADAVDLPSSTSATICFFPFVLFIVGCSSFLTFVSSVRGLLLPGVSGVVISKVGLVVDPVWQAGVTGSLWRGAGAGDLYSDSSSSTWEDGSPGVEVCGVMLDSLCEVVHVIECDPDGFRLVPEDIADTDVLVWVHALAWNLSIVVIGAGDVLQPLSSARFVSEELLWPRPFSLPNNSLECEAVRINIGVWDADVLVPPL